MFRVSQHPSSGVLKTVTAASGTGHNTGTATALPRGLIRPNQYLHTVASGLIFLTVVLFYNFFLHSQLDMEPSNKIEL